MSAQRSTPRRFKMLTHTEAAAAIKTFDTHVIEMLLDLAETDRRNLVNRYVGADRTEKIQRNNEVVAVLEGELAARRGLMSTEDILSALAASPDFVRSEARRVGKECVSPYRSRWSPLH